MSRCFIILSCIVVSVIQSVMASGAVRDSLLVGAVADSVAVSDSLSDEELLKMLATPQVDTVKKQRDRGFDVSHMINARRMRAADRTAFQAWPFMMNTFGSVRVTSLTMTNDDYSSGLQLGVSFGKWLHQDHAVRLNLEMGQWHDNYDATPVLGTELSASYIFNLTSYAFGYRTDRLFEASVVTGGGFANSTKIRSGGVSGSAFTAHIGANLNLRLFRNLDFFIEPQAVIYTNGMAVSNAGNWSSWMAAFRGTFGFTYNINQSYQEDSPLLLGRQDGYFVSFMMGPCFQNSALVYDIVGLKNSLGVHVGLSVGKYYTDYFAMRFSGAYTRNTWIRYRDASYPCNYFALRAEGMFDVAGFVLHCLAHGKPEKPHVLGASLIFGPELGYMYKVDRDDVLKTLYMGLSAGIQAKVRLGRRLALFVEPRFSIIPYDAPANSYTTFNNSRNYWDGIVNFNAGIEFLL